MLRLLRSERHLVLLFALKGLVYIILLFAHRIPVLPVGAYFELSWKA